MAAMGEIAYHRQGRILLLEALAESVETVEQQHCFKSIGCNVFQGYLFSRPLPAPDFMRFATSFSTSDDWLGTFQNRTVSTPK
jgi:EAL domain-containing protein (putative c-di-GMP-specific phosphodiesterase class I)